MEGEPDLRGLSGPLLFHASIYASVVKDLVSAVVAAVLVSRFQRWFSGRRRGTAGSGDGPVASSRSPGNMTPEQKADLIVRVRRIALRSTHAGQLTVV